MEKKLLSLCLKDVKNLLKAMELGFDYKYFGLREAGYLFGIIVWYYKEYHTMITDDSLHAALEQTNLDQESRASVIAIFAEASCITVVEPLQFILDYIVKEYKTRKIKEVLRANIDALTPDKIEDTIGNIVQESNKLLHLGKSLDHEGEYVSDIQERIQHYQSVKDKPYVGVTYGYKALDHATGGHMAGELWVILGGMKVGKTAILLNMANYAWRSGKNVVYFSAEVSKRVIQRRLDGINAYMSINDLKRGRLTPEDEKKYQDKLQELSQKKNMFYIVDRPGITTDAIRAKIRELKMQFPIDLVVVDYIGIVQLPWREKENWERVGKVAWELRNIASEEGVPLLSAQQMNKQEEIAHSMEVGRHLDLMMSIKIKNEEEKMHSPICTLEAQIKLSRDSGQAAFELEAEYSKMIIRDPYDRQFSVEDTPTVLGNVLEDLK